MQNLQQWNNLLWNIFYSIQRCSPKTKWAEQSVYITWWCTSPCTPQGCCTTHCIRGGSSWQWCADLPHQAMWTLVTPLMKSLREQDEERGLFPSFHSDVYCRSQNLNAKLTQIKIIQIIIISPVCSLKAGALVWGGNSSQLFFMPILTMASGPKLWITLFKSHH